MNKSAVGTIILRQVLPARNSCESGNWLAVAKAVRDGGVSPRVLPGAGLVRWALLGTNTSPGPMIVVSTVTALLVLIGGAFYFRHMEKNFADII